MAPPCTPMGTMYEEKGEDVNVIAKKVIFGQVVILSEVYPRAINSLTFGFFFSDLLHASTIGKSPLIFFSEQILSNRTCGLMWTSAPKKCLRNVSYLLTRRTIELSEIKILFTYK